jgi:hypothetical protein
MLFSSVVVFSVDQYSSTTQSGCQPLLAKPASVEATVLGVLAGAIDVGLVAATLAGLDLFGGGVFVHEHTIAHLDLEINP